MPNDSNSILKMVSDFKTDKWSVSKIESDLKISNGLLGKAAKGKTKISDEKFNKLEVYYMQNYVLNHLSPTEEVKETLGDLKDKVTTADKIPEPEKSKTMLDIMIEDNKKEKWVTQIEAYCGEIGILPADLIETHRLSLKMAKKGVNQGKESKIKETPMSDFRKNLIYTKTGYR